MLNKVLGSAMAATVFALATRAQAPDTGQAPAGTPQYTLDVSSRLVVEDVTVLDMRGVPVTGLPRTAFHVSDNKVSQDVFDVREQTRNATAETTPARQGGFDTNATLFRDTGSMVTLLVDPTTMSLEEQMYLRVQVMRFVDSAPAETKIAVFRCNSQGQPVLLQSPTTDKTLLRSALALTVPVMARPVDSSFENAVTELGNIAAYLHAVPGRKAVLWLAGRFPLYEPTNYALNGDDPVRREKEIKAASRALEQARIAVYPIDVRGVLQGGMLPVRVVNVDAWANDPSQTPKSADSESQKVNGQYGAMDGIAEATGGAAFYSNNAIARVMSTAVDISTHFYSLTYRPREYHADGERHTVRITVDGPYKVTYRTMYFDDSPATPRGEQERHALGAQARKPASVTADVQAPANGYDAALIFNARVITAGKGGKGETVKIRYLIPTDQLQFDSGTGTGRARFRLAVLAYNAWGDVLSQAMDVIETRYTDDQMKLASRIGTPADQTLQVAKGAQFLLLAVEDLRTEKVGTLQLPLSTVGAEIASPRLPTP